MKYLTVLFIFAFSTFVNANIDLKKLSGQWAGVCVNSQINDNQGYSIETYTFIQPNEFQLKRNWYRDGYCRGKPFETDSERGIFKIGKENTNTGLNPSNTYEVEYSSLKGKEKGLLWVSSDYKNLRISRAFGNQQNTMLGLFLYRKL